MTTKFDWSQFEQVPEQKSGFDWDSYKQVEEQKKPLLSSLYEKASKKIGSALQTAKEKPSLLATELPTAGLKAMEDWGALHDPVTAFIKSFSSKKDITPSNIASSQTRQNLPQELREGAEDIADIESLLFPVPMGAKVAKAPLGRLARKAMAHEFKGPVRASFKKVPDTLPSGLPKPRAIEAKYASKAIITPERQAATISKLDKEAASLTQQALEKHLPLSKKMQTGFDFEGMHAREFGDLRKAAEKYKPQIDLEPMAELFGETRAKYKGIPSPHREAIKIEKDIEAFAKNPPSDLNSLLKTFRSNNRKKLGIYEKSRLTGDKQQEYIDFLDTMNRSISHSIEKTLGPESAWLKKFKEMNAHYGEYQNTKKVLADLEPVLGEQLNTSSLKKLAIDPKRQAKLRFRMGEEGAKEITQIGKDLRLATDSIKKMTVKELSRFDLILPISMFVPGIGKLGFLGTVFKSAHYARKFYGYWLSKPAMRKVYDDALHAIASKDLIAYQQAADEMKSIGFNPSHEK